MRESRADCKVASDIEAVQSAAVKTQLPLEHEDLANLEHVAAREGHSGALPRHHGVAPAGLPCLPCTRVKGTVHAHHTAWRSRRDQGESVCSAAKL